MQVVIHRLHYVHDHQLVTQFKVVQVQVLVVIHRVVVEVVVVIDKYHFHHLQIMLNQEQVQNNKFPFHLIMLAVLVQVQRLVV